jgi:hypothetical protein
MYGCDLPAVMRSVRDSHWSRDYRKGTGTRVFLTKNPGLLQLASTYLSFRDLYRSAVRSALGSGLLYLLCKGNPPPKSGTELGFGGSGGWLLFFLLQPSFFLPPHQISTNLGRLRGRHAGEWVGCVWGGGGARAPSAPPTVLVRSISLLYFTCFLFIFILLEALAFSAVHDQCDKPRVA